MNRSNKAVQINYSFEVITRLARPTESPPARDSHWPNLARVIDLPEFMGRRASHPKRAFAGSCLCNCSSEDQVTSRAAAVAG
jgi:hypothetical protein